MDEMTMLAQLRDDLPDPTPQALAAARTHLTERISETEIRRTVVLLESRRPNLRRRAIIGIAAAAVIAAGAGLLTTGGGNGHQAAGPTGSTSVAPAMSQAAQALDLAAVHTLKSGDPALAAGQYTRVTTDAWRGERVDNISFLMKSRLEVWAPGDAKGTWYWRETDGLGTRFASAADEHYMRAHHPEWFTKSVSLASGHNGRQDRAPAGGPQPVASGSTANGKPQPAKPDWDFPTPAWLAEQPRDPKALLAAIEAAQPKPAPGTKPKADTPTLAFFQIAQTLASGIVPADLRAALYRAAIKLPGIELVSSTASIDGRKGIAIGRLEPFGYLRQEIIFDSAAGKFLGEREVVVQSNADDAHLPVGATYSSTAVTTAVTGNPHLF